MGRRMWVARVSGPLPPFTVGSRRGCWLGAIRGGRSGLEGGPPRRESERRQTATERVRAGDGVRSRIRFSGSVRGLCAVQQQQRASGQRYGGRWVHLASGAVRVFGVDLDAPAEVPQRIGTVNSSGSHHELSISMNGSSGRVGSPVSPLSAIATARAKESLQSCDVIGMPSGRYQSRSSRVVSGAGVPWKNWRRRNTGCCSRSRHRPAVKSTRSWCCAAAFQSNQASSLCWQ